MAIKSEFGIAYTRSKNSNTAKGICGTRRNGLSYASTMKYRRIHIVGGAGSGKTTLAQRYAREYAVPHYELDNMMWLEAAARKPRTAVDRDRMLRQAIDSECWVIDGIFWQEWVVPSLERADRIIVLDIPEMTLHFRVVRRHFQLVMQADPGEYRHFFPTLLELIKLNHNYRNGPLKKTLALLSAFEDKVVVYRTNGEAMRELSCR